MPSLSPTNQRRVTRLLRSGLNVTATAKKLRLSSAAIYHFTKSTKLPTNPRIDTRSPLATAFTILLLSRHRSSLRAVKHAAKTLGLTIPALTRLVDDTHHHYAILFSDLVSRRSRMKTLHKKKRHGRRSKKK